MKTFVILVLVWLGIVGVFIAAGYRTGDDEANSNRSIDSWGYRLACRAEHAVLGGGLGFAVATPVVSGLLFIHLSRREHVRKRWGILAEAGLVILMPIVVVSGMRVASDTINMRMGTEMAPFTVLRGEAGFGMFAIAIASFWMAVICFVGFSVWGFIHRRDQTA
jgi:hypothetical protein